MEPIIDHVQITVRDMSVTVSFYDELMPLLGFDPKSRSGVDGLHAKVADIDATIVSPPRE
jgi:catechol 2,3-dioxygenase-like lactoylglutathione lyase family enzyme